MVIKLSFCSYFEHKVSKFGQYFEVDVQARFLKLKFGHCFAVDASCDYEVQDRFGQEFCKNL